MAVEARHLDLFPPQIPTNRESVANGVEGNGNLFRDSIGYGAVAPSSAETVVPMYAVAGGNFPGKTAVAKTCGSGIAYAPISRKRSRGAINSLISSLPGAGGFTFLGEDISFQIQQQQMEIDRFVAQHAEKLRTEIEERRKSYCRRIEAAVDENMMKKLMSREEEIRKIGKLNYSLEERVKSLSTENQIWRELAQSNEATANALRSNLEQVLAQVRYDQQRPDAAADDAYSCCGSNLEEDDAARNRVCRGCEREESCVVLLPCRHLCLCSICGSTLCTCPVCNATKIASVYVNLSG